MLYMNFVVYNNFMFAEFRYFLILHLSTKERSYKIFFFKISKIECHKNYCTYSI